eukprot:Skav202720  [mRNA]  locus=scaffold654:835216:838033:- [translate_table: standard]
MAVQCVKWWMAHFKAPTPKRHWAYCNSKAIHRLDRGKLQGWKKSKDKKKPTAEHYIDSKGKKRYKGTIYPMPFAREICDLQDELKASRMGQPQLPEVVPPAAQTFTWLQDANPEVALQTEVPAQPVATPARNVANTPEVDANVGEALSSTQPTSSGPDQSQLVLAQPVPQDDAKVQPSNAGGTAEPGGAEADQALPRKASPLVVVVVYLTQLLPPKV